ncbi:fibrobacter succinogenes major paralogous domain-containing protein [Ornithobacterium rhinotracheale]|uniref:fibrobacter succinogenes major paralogous domain-containing protein n=1 Tax=Ornithobacterium rhinotracheale TaxID=28251 RepID=UPI001FF4AE22|nr:fibrobacter succinogenes major paralogous domain-containing protein [Ornithobacterium rhinotracheale]MCK0199654.1 fibrobacter succinogenes major paralogous domain-containing protein [Ornithobacterium rhinotracheale]
MKRSFYLLGMLLAGGVALAQQDAEGRVGVNTTTPNASLEVSRNDELFKKDETQAQGVTFPNFSTEERSKFENVAVGTMIFNTDKQCLEMYFGVVNGVHQWSCIPDVNNKQSQNVSVEPAGWSGQFVGGVALNGQSVKFKLVNNGFGGIANVDFSDAVSIQNASSGASKQGNVSVKQGQHTSVSLNGGESKVLTYQLEGTPQAGTLVAKFEKLGLSADQQTVVGLGSATLQNAQPNYTVSLVYNQTKIQGRIDNGSNKVTIKIPYTNGKGSYNAFSQTVAAAKGQGNDANNLTLDIAGGNFGVKGELTATIKVDGDGEYLVKQLAPGQSYDIATFNVALNGGGTAQVVLKGIGGIPDKNFNVMTNGKYEHRFIYVPVKGRDGKLWLNNNLGANYANMDHPAFNPVQGAKSLRDENAYGSHFQFGRAADGHELTTYTSSTSGSMIHPNMQWYSNSQLQSYTNPCPAGYHVPTKQEWEAYQNLLPNKNAQAWQSDVLHLTYAGDKDAGGWGPNPGNPFGYYWSSSPYGSSPAWYLVFNDSNSHTSNYDSRYWGRPLRCRQD